MTVDRAALEQPIRAAVERGDIDGATTRALRLYGTELFGFVASIARDPGIADDAFSELCEVVWKHLAGFRWEASLRSWMYLLARRIVIRERALGSKRAARQQPIENPELAELAATIRTETLEILRTDVKDAFRALRDELAEEDQELLALRVDRDMSWRDIARIFDDDPESLDARATTLRKRFERVKDRLRDLANERGLLVQE